MKLTNQYSYPASLVRAVEQSIYRPEPGHFGVTSIAGPPLIHTLRRTRWDDITVDVDEFVRALFGTAWHAYLDRYSGDDLSEIAWQYQTRGVVVRGKSDLYHGGGIIDDHKTCSSWSFIFGTDDWERQLNLYSLLAQKNGYPVNELYINAFILDWSQYDAMKRKRDGYPTHRFYRIRVPHWTQEKQEAYLNERLDDHLNNPERECTPEEKWAKPDQYAVMKEGRKTAMRVLDTEAEALAWIDKQKKDKGKLSITHRKGGCKRCEEYCLVRSVCPFRSVT